MAAHMRLLEQYAPFRLNRDYARRNEDRTKVPDPWKGLAMDTRIRFKLARVTRTRTTRTSFSTDDAVKYAGSGGIPPFEPETHRVEDARRPRGGAARPRVSVALTAPEVVSTI
jgi:hypothetical protein